METLNDALIACVKAAGGSKKVGPILWPEKGEEAAQRLLLDCLNLDRPQHLTPEQMVLLFRLARDKGHHAGIGFVLEQLGYAPTSPIEPKDEAAELQRQFIESVKAQQALLSRLERIGPALRSVA